MVSTSMGIVCQFLLFLSFPATSQLGCPLPQFNRPWKSHNNRQRKMPPEAGIAIGGVIGVIY
jgi:hypothetical protein